MTMAISDALAELKAFIIDHCQAEQITTGCQYVDELTAAIDNRISELLTANNVEVERRRAAEALAREAKDVLERGLSLMETVEAKTLVGDEGCLWPVEMARELIERIGKAT